MRTIKIWTEAEDTIIKILYGKLPIKEVAEKLKVSNRQVRDRAKNLKLKLFTEEQLEYLKNNLTKDFTFFKQSPLFIGIPKNTILAKLNKLRGISWTKADTELLISLSTTKTLDEILTYFPGRNKTQLRMKLYDMSKRGSNKKWTTEEIDYILFNYNLMKKEDIAKALKVSVNKIYSVYAYRNFKNK